MRYQPLSRRLINLIYPLVIYMAIGMAVLGLYPNGGLMANLIEKVSCIIIMGILFYKDSKQIRWEGKKLSLYSAIIMIIIGICACIGVNILFELTGLKTIREEDAKNVAKALYSDKLWLQILVVGIAAPVAEELLFRGILYRRMRTWLSVGPSALAALLIFAAVHGNLLQALYAFILGALLVWTYERFAKLTAPIILHVSANLISILVQQSTWLSSYLQTYAVAACIIGLAGASAGVVYITKRPCSSLKNCI